MANFRLLFLIAAVEFHGTVLAEPPHVEDTPRDSPPSGLFAGVARIDITPPVGIAQMNWGSQTHIESDGNDPVGMAATALVISDGEQSFAMVDIDRLFVRGLEPAIKRAADKTGIPAGHIRLAATHTHSGVAVSSAKGPPGVDLEPYRKMVARYNAEILDKIAEVIVAAHADLQPVHLFAGRGTGSININRRVRAEGKNPPAVGRNPEAFVDRELNVIRIDRAGGRPLAVIANFPCHGTVLAYANRKVSPDWVGKVRAVVERSIPGSTCLFFQGAAGNQGPIEGFTGDLRIPHRLGSILGHETAAVALQIETVDRAPQFEGFVESTAFQAKQHWRVRGPRDATLKFASKMIELPRRTFSKTEIEGMQVRLDDTMGKIAAARESGDPWALHQILARSRRLADLLEAWKQPADVSPVRLEIEVLRIGEVAIISMPGEPFAEIGAAVRKASPFLFTLFCGYSDGIGGGYLPVKEEFELGGYEVERSPYGPGAAAKLIAEAKALLESVR